jgi:hypothetical protein
MVTFRCYDPSADASGGIHRWYYREIPPNIQAEIDATLELLEVEPTLDGHPSFKPLRGKCLGLAEIKIDIPLEKEKGRPKNKQRRKGKRKRRERTEINVRILGPDRAPNIQFILLTGFIKLGDSQYGPMCKQAHSRKRGVEKNAAKAKSCSFP